MMNLGRATVVGLILSLYLGAALGAAADEPEPRIVSLSPHITELLFAAGAGSRVVGVDDSSDYPAAALKITRVGEVAALDVEALLKLKPTLVIVWDSGTPPRRRAELEHLNLRLYVTEQRHLDDIGAALVKMGRLAGSLPVATEAAREYALQLARLRARYAHRPRLKVFYQVWDRPLYTLSGGQVVNEVLALCGGDNIFADLDALAPAVDKEAVLVRDPDVILIGAGGADGARQVRDWGRFSSLRAVRGQHVSTVDPSLLSRMAPRILLGVQQVCTALDEARTGAPPGSRLPRPSPIQDSRPMT